MSPHLTSVINKFRHHRYSHICSFLSIITPLGNQIIKVIDRGSTSLAIFVVQVLFTNLDIIIDILLSVVRVDVPTRFLLMNMFQNCPEVLFQGQYVSLWRRHQSLTMESCFHIHRGWEKNMHSSICTEQELGTLNRTFGHPSARVLQKLFEMAAGFIMKLSTERSLQKMIEEYELCRKTTAAPRRLKLTRGSSSQRFNHRVFFDTIFIYSCPVTQPVYERHISARPLFSQSRPRTNSVTGSRICGLLST